MLLRLLQSANAWFKQKCESPRALLLVSVASGGGAAITINTIGNFALSFLPEAHQAYFWLSLLKNLLAFSGFAINATLIYNGAAIGLDKEDRHTKQIALHEVRLEQQRETLNRLVIDQKNSQDFQKDAFAFLMQYSHLSEIFTKNLSQPELRQAAQAILEQCEPTPFQAEAYARRYDSFDSALERELPTVAYSRASGTSALRKFSLLSSPASSSSDDDSLESSPLLEEDVFTKMATNYA